MTFSVSKLIRGSMVLLSCMLAGHATAASPESTDNTIEPEPSMADLEVGIRPDKPSVGVMTANGEIIIQRIQDQSNEISGDFARTSRPCPPFCIQPMQVAEETATIGELELLEYLQRADAMVIDSRTLEWYLESTIPGSVHIPYTEVASRLDELGCQRSEEKWNCQDAKTVALFCNGPWCGQSPTAIRAMLREGYPADRIAYYRGGMQLWKMLGLTVVEGDF